MELIDFVQNDDVRWAVIVAQAFEKDVGRGRLTMNVDGLVETFEDAVECLVVGIVFPAVHVLRFEFDDGLAETVKRVLGDTGFPSAGEAVQESGLGGLPIGDGAEGTVG